MNDEEIKNKMKERYMNLYDQNKKNNAKENNKNQNSDNNNK